MHGGKVELYSEGLKRGSEFCVSLPLAKKDVEKGMAVEVPLLNSSGRTMRVLVVDDNRDAALSLAMMLRLMQYETVTAHDGLEALKMAESTCPDLVLLDIGMPKLDGYEVARQVRSQSWGREIFLVALTGWGQEEDRRASARAGFDAHLVKPVEMAALREILVAIEKRI